MRLAPEIKAGQLRYLRDKATRKRELAEQYAYLPDVQDALRAVLTRDLTHDLIDAVETILLAEACCYSEGQGAHPKRMAELLTLVGEVHRRRR